MRFKRSEGLTPSEKILADLCESSFLKLADLVVAFGNDVLIFSDKSCEFPNH